MSIPLTPTATTTGMRQALAVDGRSLNALKVQAGDAQGAKGATQEAAKQLESLFMRELIKSMREATAKSGLLAKLWKPIALGLLAVGAFFKRIFTGRSKESI